MSDDIIKNKAREAKATNMGRRVAYQPEYERLNIEPTVHKINPHDFMMNKKVSRKLPVQSPAQHVQQRMPQSGQNEDIIWSQGPGVSSRVNAIKQDVSNEILEQEDGEAFDSIDDKSFEPNSNYNRSFRYDDIPSAPSSLIEDDINLEGQEIAEQAEQEQEQEQEQEEQEEREEEQELQEDQVEREFKFSDLRTGDNILLHNDEVICAGSLEEIKEVLSKILLNSNDYLVEEFVVLKRLNVRAGIFID
jgi:hypothetical protein